MNTALNNTLAQADTLKKRLQAVRPIDVEALRKIQAALKWNTLLKAIALRAKI